MIKLSDIMSLEDLEQEISDGYVNRRLHPSAPLACLNYSPKTQFEYRFNHITEQTRGLIYNTETLEVVVRPWKKFHNWDARGQQYPPAGPMILSEKMDGSMISVFVNPVTGDFECASRGSFMSDQAVYATEVFQARMDRMRQEDYSSWVFNVGEFSNPFRTYLFELVAPWNRIVVAYGDRDELVLLDVLDNETGKQDLEKFGDLVWDSRAEKILVPQGFSHSIIDRIPEGDEGFVLSWPERGFMCKMKSSRYLELHKLVFGLSEKSVWQQITDGKTVDEVKDGLPDEFYEFVDKTYHKLKTRQLEIYTEVLDAWSSIAGDGSSPALLTRKGFAIQAVKYKGLSQYLFKILDGAGEKVIMDMIWETLKPVGETHVKSQNEDSA